jgi:hypothetical protein
MFSLRDPGNAHLPYLCLQALLVQVILPLQVPVLLVDAVGDLSGLSSLFMGTLHRLQAVVYAHLSDGARDIKRV